MNDPVSISILRKMNAKQAQRLAYQSAQTLRQLSNQMVELRFLYHGKQCKNIENKRNKNPYLVPRVHNLKFIYLFKKHCEYKLITSFQPEVAYLADSFYPISKNSAT